MISDQALILGLGVVAVVSLVGNLAQAFYAAHLEVLVERPAGRRLEVGAIHIEARAVDEDAIAATIKAHLTKANGHGRAF